MEALYLGNSLSPRPVAPWSRAGGDIEHQVLLLVFSTESGGRGVRGAECRKQRCAGEDGSEGDEWVRARPQGGKAREMC
jgi:hypothetical protein